MPKNNNRFYFLFLIILAFSCKKNTTPITPPPVTLLPFTETSLKVNGINNGFTYYAINTLPEIKFSFSAPIDQNTVTNNISFKTSAGAVVSLTTSYENGDSTAVLKPSTALSFITQYAIRVGTGLKSRQGASLQTAVNAILITSIDSTDKFPHISDSALLTLIQQQTFKYFWDFGHPVSGLAREGSDGRGEMVTTGGSGFGIMAMVAAVNRGFITRSDAVTRLNTITDFLITKCQRWHGAFSHWIDGSTGATIPFGNNNGADIVETSFLVQGLLTARQYFNSTTDVNEIALRDSINSIWNAVEWN